VAADRIRGFRRALQEGLAERSVPTAHGVARLVDSCPAVYDANYLWVDGPVAPAEVLAAECDGALADRHHRRVVVEGGGAGLADRFVELGYSLSTHLVLVHEREPDRRVDTSPVRPASLEELLPVRTRQILDEPWGDDDIAAQLNEAKRHVAAAVPTRFFAVIADGEIAGYCELRLRDGVAQIEDVEVLERFRGRGLGRAIVQHALDEGLASADLVFLEALADDWPRELYARLGFVVVDRSDLYTRLPHALTRLHLRTPRLELRLGTIAELRRLFAVASDGAAPGGLEEGPFIALHERALASWRADEWALHLIGFSGSEPIGSEALGAAHFAKSRTLTSDGWLGRAWQGQGSEDEMRAAALTLAFDGLGARKALVDRGREVQRDAFPRSVPVAIAGLDRVRSLFGGVS